MVTPRRFDHVDDREYDSVGCFCFKDTPEDSFACFSSSSIQFNLILMLWLPTWPVMRGCNAAR